MTEPINNNDNLNPNESAEISVENDLDKLKKERDEYLDGWKRAKADFLNYKKEEASRLTELARFGTADLIRELLVVLDSFDLGLATLEKEGKELKGFYLIRSQFEDVLKKRGLERATLSPGQAFDPMVHDAIAMVESDLPEGAIVEEVERGYLLNGRLIRPAKVMVAKKKE